MEFANRDRELTFLESRYKEPAFQFVALYGRRRVGKTRLVQEFIQGKPALYFLADNLAETEQMKNLGREVGAFFHDAILQEAGFADWYQFFGYLKERAATRFILVIDEFPYLVNANPAISSVFQKGIDNYLKGSRLFLVLMGSSIGMMEKEVLYCKAPLYGRRTASLEVGEMPFEALEAFFPSFDFRNRLAVFAVLGTIPAYLEQVPPGKGFLQALPGLVLERGAFLYNEVEFLLREELREPRNYFVILRSIAQGKRKLSEIINDTGFDKSHLSRYLDILRSLGLVDKEIPVTEKYPEKSRAGLYRIHDRFFSFWFRYIFPNRGRIEIGQAAYVLGRIRESFDQHLSLAYEDAARDICLRLMRDGKISFTSIGRWWQKNEEIDLVALDEEAGTALFGECKWSRKKVGEDVLAELVRKASLVDWNRKTRRERFILFSRAGFTDAVLRLAREKDLLLVEGETLLTP